MLFIESPGSMVNVFWDKNGLVYEYDLAVPKTTMPNERIKNKNSNNLDFFKNKGRVSPSKTKRVVHGNRDFLINWFQGCVI